MPTISIDIAGDLASSVTLLSIVDSSGGSVPTVHLPAAFAGVGGTAFALTFTGAAAYYAYVCQITWQDNTTSSQSGTVAGDNAGASSGDLIGDIALNANQPRSASQDGGSASQHSLPDQMAADRYLKAAAVKRGTGIRFVQQRPPSNSDVSFER